MALRKEAPKGHARRHQPPMDDPMQEIAEALRLPTAKAGESKARRAKWERQLGTVGSPW